MGGIPNSLLASIEAFLDAVPTQTAISLCDLVRGVPLEKLANLEPQALGAVPYPKSARLFCALVRECYAAGLAGDSRNLADWIATMARSEKHRANRIDVELIWTGPVPTGSYLRRTDQALQEVINEAEHYLLIVSFAVYKVAHISEALSAAVLQGVKVDVVMESAEDKSMFGDMIGADDKVRFLIWPESKRTVAPNGYRGAMHAKCAVADESLAYVSSANLTEFALSINMEIGLFIRGGTLPAQIRQHFDNLFDEGILEPLSGP